MKLSTKQQKTHTEYWHKTAKNSWKTTNSLMDSRRNDACLFFCHLSLEKIIKGLVVVETKQLAPHSHNLSRLADLANLKINKEQKEDLKTITGFNMAGRYPDIKLAFYEQCTDPYTFKYFRISKELYLWLEKKYPNN